MTKDEAKFILATLAAAYPQAYKHIDVDETNGIASVWAIQFTEIPADIVFLAVNKAIATCKFPPTICEVKEKVQEIAWEAYEVISSKLMRESLDEAVLNKYQRIYNITKEYKNIDYAPKLNDMLSGGEVGGYLSIRKED